MASHLAAVEKPDRAVIKGWAGIRGPLRVTEARDLAALHGYDGAQGTISPVERADIARIKGSAGIWGPLKVAETRDLAAAHGAIGGSGRLASFEKPDTAKAKGYSGSWGPLRVTGLRDQMVARAVRGIWGPLHYTEAPDRANFRGPRFLPPATPQTLQQRETPPMPNQLSGQRAATPREYNSHQRHSKLARLRYSAKVKRGQLGEFLAFQATRLSSTAAVIFAKVTKYGAARVKAAANLAAIP